MLENRRSNFPKFFELIPSRTHAHNKFKTKYNFLEIFSYHRRCNKWEWKGLENSPLSQPSFLFQPLVSYLHFPCSPNKFNYFSFSSNLDFHEFYITWRVHPRLAKRAGTLPAEWKFTFYVFSLFGWGLRRKKIVSYKSEVNSILSEDNPRQKQPPDPFPTLPPNHRVIAPSLEIFSYFRHLEAPRYNKKSSPRKYIRNVIIKYKPLSTVFACWGKPPPT